MKVRLVRIGNSRGVRIPKPVLEQCHLDDAVELEVKNGTLVIAPARWPREGWEEAFRAAGPSAHDEMLLDGSTANDFDQENWRW